MADLAFPHPRVPARWHNLAATYNQREATVNGSQQGDTPVRALTDAGGMAVFRIRWLPSAESQRFATTEPTYFEANLEYGRRYYPYGYSQILLVRFVP